MDNRYFTILGHATGRLLLKRPGYEIDIERVIQHARANGCFFEINSSPDRLDLSAENARLAREAGVKVAITTDAHAIREFEYIRGASIKPGTRRLFEGMGSELPELAGFFTIGPALGDYAGPAASSLSVRIRSMRIMQKVEQQADRTKHKGQNQTGDEQQMRNLMLLGVAHLPAADEKIEGEIMDPTRQQQPIVRKQRMNLRQRSEAACSFAPMRGNQKSIK